MDKKEWIKNIRIAESNNISYDTFRFRVIRGEKVETARTTPVKKKGRNKYDKYYEICKKNNIPRVTFRRRVMRGMSLSVACTKPVETKFRGKSHVE